MNVVELGVDEIEHGNAEGGGLAGAVLGSRQDVAPHECFGHAGLLDGRRLLKPFLVDARKQLALEVVVVKLHIFFGVGDVLHGTAVRRAVLAAW